MMTAEPFDPNDRVTHTPDHGPLALSLWVAFQQQLAQLKARSAVLLQVWEAEDAQRQRDAIAKRSRQSPSP